MYRILMETHHRVAFLLSADVSSGFFSGYLGFHATVSVTGIMRSLPHSDKRH